MSDFIDGFLIECALIMTVGLQNAFILKQGIRSEYVFTAVITCFLAETFLVTVGVAGMGAILSSVPMLIKGITLAGIGFLAFYSVKSFYMAFRGHESLDINSVKEKSSTMRNVIWQALGFSLLNPHVLIDTTLMGALSTKYYPHQWIFWTGVVTAALVWYSFLGSLGRLLAKPLNSPKTWRVINVIIGLLCAYMAYNFVVNFNEPHLQEHTIENHSH